VYHHDTVVHVIFLLGLNCQVLDVCVPMQHTPVKKSANDTYKSTGTDCVVLPGSPE